MQTRQIGSTGLSLTVLGFGAAPLGNLYTAVSDPEAASAVNVACDMGIGYFDTAPHYGLGLSERRLGAALGRYARDDIVVSTKVGRLLVPVTDVGPERDLGNGFGVPADLQRRWDFSRDGVLRSIDESLTRLGFDHVDVVFVHDPDQHEREALDQAIPALLELREQGAVRAVGAGMNQSAMLTRFVERSDLDVVLLAGRYTLLEQGGLDDLLPAAQKHGTAVVAGGVFGSGLLARDWPADDATYDYGPAPAEVLAKARRAAQLCGEHGVTLPAVALQLVLAHDVVVCALLGMRSADEVRRNTALLDVVVPPGLWTALRAESLLREDAPVPVRAAPRS